MCLARRRWLMYHWAAGRQQRADLSSRSSRWRTEDTLWRDAASADTPAVPAGSWTWDHTCCSHSTTSMDVVRTKTQKKTIPAEAYLCVGWRLRAVQGRRWKVQSTRNQDGQEGAEIFGCIQQRGQRCGQNIHPGHDWSLKDLLDGNLQHVPVFTFQQFWRKKSLD